MVSRLFIINHPNETQKVEPTDLYGSKVPLLPPLLFFSGIRPKGLSRTEVPSGTDMKHDGETFSLSDLKELFLVSTEKFVDETHSS